MRSAVLLAAASVSLLLAGAGLAQSVTELRKARLVFQWVGGSDHRTIEINGLTIKNTNACLIDLEGQGRLELDITGARIRVKDYGTTSFPGTRRICGSTDQRPTYDCPSAPGLNEVQKRSK